MRLYSWLPRGSEDHLYNQQRRQPLHVIAAVTDTDIVTFVVQTHTIKSDDFYALIPSAAEILRKQTKEEPNCSTSLT
jgi:hypothetical protein